MLRTVGRTSTYITLALVNCQMAVLKQTHDIVYINKGESYEISQAQKGT